jgi:Domain of unknown function (DUF5615)
MRPLLIDEGLPHCIAAALRALELSAHAIGDDGAPPRQSDDEQNCEWCKEHGAVLVTNDRGKENPVIRKALRKHGVAALFVYRDLRGAPPHRLAFALLKAEPAIDDLAKKKSPEPRRLHASGTTRPLQRRKKR